MPRRAYSSDSIGRAVFADVPVSRHCHRLGFDPGYRRRRSAGDDPFDIASYYCGHGFDAGYLVGTRFAFTLITGNAQFNPQSGLPNCWYGSRGKAGTAIENLA